MSDQAWRTVRFTIGCGTVAFVAHLVLGFIGSRWVMDSCLSWAVR